MTDYGLNLRQEQRIARTPQRMKKLNELEYALKVEGFTTYKRVMPELGGGQILVFGSPELKDENVIASIIYHDFSYGNEYENLEMAFFEDGEVQEPEVFETIEEIVDAIHASM